jgi:hypothetical protein
MNPRFICLKINKMTTFSKAEASLRERRHKLKIYMCNLHLRTFPYGVLPQFLWSLPFRSKTKNKRGKKDW